MITPVFILHPQSIILEIWLWRRRYASGMSAKNFRYCYRILKNDPLTLRALLNLLIFISFFGSFRSYYIQLFGLPGLIFVCFKYPKGFLF